MKTNRTFLASTPSDWTAKSWKRVLRQTVTAIGKKDLATYAAGVAYYSILSFFPLIVVAVSIAGLTTQQQELEKMVMALGHYLPQDVAALITSQIQTATAHRSGSILAICLSVAVSLFGASGAMDMIITALNKCYEVKEKRGYIRKKLVSLLLTLSILASIAIVAVIFFFGGVFFQHIGAPQWGVDIFLWLRWAFLIACVMMGLSLLYNHAPNRKREYYRFQISWGAIMATVAWAVVSVIFYAYLQYFGNYSKNYSAYAGIIGLMVWLNYSAFVLLLGAEINHRLERERK